MSSEIAPMNSEITIGNETEDKIMGLVYGHALGSAVGLGTEFKFKSDNPNVEFPYEDPIRDYSPCDWTVDTDHLILVMNELTKIGASGGVKSDIKDGASDNIKDNLAGKFTEALCNWFEHGFPECDDENGVGSSTISIMVKNPRFKTNPSEIANEIWLTSGKKFATNSSLTRSYILGATDTSTENVGELCRTTHVDSRCVVACNLAVMIVRNLINNNIHSANNIDEILNKSIDNIRGLDEFKQNEAELSTWTELAYTKNIANIKLDELTRITYVMKCLACSIYSLQVIKKSLEVNKTPSFKKIITLIAGECGDADSNCAAAGAIMGAYLGYSKLPKDWIEAMPYHEWLTTQVKDFIKQTQTQCS